MQLVACNTLFFVCLVVCLLFLLFLLFPRLGGLFVNLSKRPVVPLSIIYSHIPANAITRLCFYSETTANGATYITPSLNIVIAFIKCA